MNIKLGVVMGGGTFKKILVTMIIAVAAFFTWLLAFDHEHWALEGLKCDRVYVLNLDVAVDRMKVIREALKKEDVPTERFSAIDGRKLMFVDPQSNTLVHVSQMRDVNAFFANPNIKCQVLADGAEDASFVYDWKARLNSGYMHPFNISLGELGCCYSHRAIWSDMIKRDCKVALILEDDALPMEGFKEKLRNVLNCIPEDAEIVYLDFTDFKPGMDGIREIDDNEHVGRFMGNITCLGTHAYLVTRRGAQKLLVLTQVVGMPIDITICIYAATGQITRYVALDKMITVNERFTSDIIKMGRSMRPRPTLELLRYYGSARIM